MDDDAELIRKPSPEELADIRGDARGQPRRLGRGRGALRGLARRGRGAHPFRRDQPVRGRDAADRRPPRPLPTGHPPPVRGRPRHAVALEPGGRRGRRRRLQPAHARPRRAPQRGDRRAGALGPGRRARDPARARRHRRPRVHRPRVAHLARRPRRLGGRDRPAAVTRRPVRPVRGTSRRSGCSTPTPTATGSRPTTTTSAGPRHRAAGRPSTSTGCRSPTRDQSWKFARAWTLGEVITALLGADLRLEERGGAPGRLVGRPRRRAGRGARPDPAVVLGGRPQGTPELRPGRGPRIGRPGSVGRARPRRSPERAIGP